jgi:hypothetical protein
MNEELNIEKVTKFMNSFRGQLIVGQALNVAIETMKNRQPEWMREPSNISDMEYILKNVPMMGILSDNKNPAYDTFITIQISDSLGGWHEYEMYGDNYVNGQIAIEVAKALDFMHCPLQRASSDISSDISFNSTGQVQVWYEMIPKNDFPDGEYVKRIIYPILE